MQENDDLEQQIAQLKAELESEKAKSKKGLHLKVSEKGCASLYGIRRFPISLYLDEWIRVLDMEDEIRQFLADNQQEMEKKREK